MLVLKQRRFYDMERKNERCGNEGPAFLAHLLLHLCFGCVPFFNFVKSICNI